MTSAMRANSMGWTIMKWKSSQRWAPLILGPMSRHNTSITMTTAMPQ